MGSETEVTWAASGEAVASCCVLATGSLFEWVDSEGMS